MRYSEAFETLHPVLGERLSRSKPDLDMHSRSESWFAPALPDAIAWPETTREVQAIVQACAQHDCPIVGWGAGTSLEAHALAISGGLVVDFSRMNKVLEIRPADRLIWTSQGFQQFPDHWQMNGRLTAGRRRYWLPGA